MYLLFYFAISPKTLVKIEKKVVYVYNEEKELSDGQ